MKSSSERALDNIILTTLVVLGAACILSLALVPRPTSAAAVSVTSITATSTNVYVNTGFATTSRVTTGDTVNYQLTLGGTPLIAPQINVFLMGSTTMSGSGTNWFYATTSVTAWTAGAVTFRLGVGGTAGDATTTITQSSVTTNVIYDTTAPTLNSLSWSDVDSSTQFSATDTFTLTFSETMATSTIVAGNVDARLALSGSHTFGTSPTVSWNTAGTVLTLTLGTSPTVATADTVDPTTAVVDSVGIADATAAALTITDNVVPGDPTGLTNTNFRNSISVSLAATGSSQIRYTTDSTTPSCSSGTVYSSAITITETTTLKAIGCDEANNASSVITAIYTLSSGGGGGGNNPSTTPATPATPASPSSRITSAQVDSILGLLAAFEADSTVIANVKAALSGESSASLTHGFVTSTFVRNLESGALGEEVRALQIFLNSHGHPVAASGPGSSGNETTTFGPLTRAALIAYQKSKGITPAIGFFGPKTRAAVNAEQ